ncbi:MAG: tetratricopeptide repeat protein [Bacteroidia bacterium]
MRLLLFSVQFFFAFKVVAFHLKFNEQLVQSQLYINELRLNKAEQIIRSEKLNSPNNLACDYLLEYVYFYRVITSQSQTHLKQYKQLITYNNARYQQLADNIPEKKLFLAQMSLHEAFANVLFEEYLKAALLIRNANKLLVQNEKNFPNYFANKKNLSIIETLAGTLPDNYKWVASIAGMPGSFVNGLSNLLNYINQSDKQLQNAVDAQEAKLAYVILMAQFSDDKQTPYNYCKENLINCKTNLIHVFINAFVSLEHKKPFEVLKCIEQFNKTNEYPDFYFLDYMLARAKLYLNHRDADVWFKKYVTFGNDEQIKKESYRKLSWISLLKGDTIAYKIYFRQSAKSKKSEEDEHIRELLAENKFQDKQILQARIYFDGGRYNDAINILENINHKQIQNKYEQIEYFYRLGRVYYENNNLGEAVLAFQKSVQIAETTIIYMVPYAEYYTALCYVKLNKKDLAKLHLKKALSYSGYQYESTLKQKVKAALSGIET